MRLVSSDVTVTAKSGDESVALDSAYQSLTSWTAERNVQVDYSAAFALGSYSYAYGISAKYDDEATVSTYSASGSATTDIWMYEDSANGALAERYLDPTTNQASYYDLSTSSGTAEWDSGVGLYYSTNPLSWLADGSYDTVSQNLDSKFNAYFSDDGSLTLESKSTEMSESDADLVGINNSALAFIYADEVIGSYVETVYAPTITITFGQGGTTIDSLSLSVPVTMPDVVSGSNIDLTYTVSSVSALAEKLAVPTITPFANTSSWDSDPKVSAMAEKLSEGNYRLDIASTGLEGDGLPDGVGSADYGYESTI